MIDLLLSTVDLFDRSGNRTIPRKNFTTIKAFVEEPESRAQCVTLEENVKEFGVTYFGMTDRRQGTCQSISLFFM